MGLGRYALMVSLAPHGLGFRFFEEHEDAICFSARQQWTVSWAGGLYKQ